jgi:hypothetical protein
MMPPNQLKSESFRFYLAANNKRPLEQKWNSTNALKHDDLKLLEHNGCYGICTGYGGLIVVDFDDREYYDKVKRLLPHTFCVKTAIKQLYHLYFILDGEMINKVGIDIDGKRVCDIQAAGAGIIAPESYISMPDGTDRYYRIVTDVPIAHISLAKLKEVFQFQESKKREWNGMTRTDPEAMQQAMITLHQRGIRRRGAYKYECPFHKMSGGGNLVLFRDGALKCFHCDSYWSSISWFIQDLDKTKGEAK